MTYGQTNTQPAIMQPTQDPPPAYTRSGQQMQPQTKPALNTAELQVSLIMFYFTCIDNAM